MADEMYDNLWERTKRKPGYVVDLGFQLMTLFAVLQIFAEMTTATNHNVAVVIVYGLVAVAALDNFAPRVGRQLKQLTNGFADIYWSGKE